MKKYFFCFVSGYVGLMQMQVNLRVLKVTRLTCWFNAIRDKHRHASLMKNFIFVFEGQMVVV